jgi:genome maintenance exonuclease 1
MYKAPRIPSVSKVLSTTQSPDKKAGLERWRKKVGEKEADRICNDSKSRGIYIHGLIENKLKNITPQEHFENEYLEKLNVDVYWELMEPVVEKIQFPYAIEQPVVHADLHYQGRFDMLAYWNNKLTIIDFKTKTKPVKEEYLEDDFTQLAAYAGAIEFNRPELKVEQGLIIAVNPEGSQLFVLNKEQLNGSWNTWCLRLMDFDQENIEIINKYLILSN